MDPVSPEIAQKYMECHANFECVGPLLDKEGARRAAGMKTDQGSSTSKPQAETETSLIAAVCRAQAAGRRVVLASMGTMLTGDHSTLGWKARKMDADGILRGLTGQELCRGAWGGVFDALGCEDAEEGPLIVVALGPQPDALGDMVPPANAMCAASFPQVDLLKFEVDLFLTHGGQNSFTEALSNGVPLVVCPGFGDQPINARKSETVGVGRQVPRPFPVLGAEVKAVTQYGKDVAQAVSEVFNQPAYRERAARFKESLQLTGGVQRAAQVMLDSVKEGQHLCSKAPGPRQGLKVDASMGGA